MATISIEEKAKAYDRAFKEAEKIHNFSSDIAEVKRMEQIFPELKESEDEKIRKDIVEAVELHKDFTQVRKEHIYAWLEKQGGITKLSEEELNRFAKGVLTRCAMSFIDYLEAHKYEGKMCVSNGECKDIENAFHNDTWDRLHRYYCKYIEKQGEQKPANKVEPKFHEGDWCIDNEDDTIFQIVKVLDNTYTYKTNEGKEYSCTHYSLENDVRLWTIQDAKDGDVLVNWNNTIYLFKGIEEEVVKFYCYYNTNCEEFKTPLNNNSHLGLTESQFEHHPATKEQRDLLFLKMKEAGYEWDAEKKELKKIEQIPAELDENRSKELSLSLQIQAYLNTASDELYAKGKSLYSEERIKDVHKCMLMWQKLHNAYFYQKPVWSEEDEKIIKEVISNYESAYLPPVLERERILKELKSLKDRAQPQSDWSEDDEERLSDAIFFVREYQIPTRDKRLLNAAKEAEDWLKSLRPQNRWKPSDEQMDALREAVIEMGKSVSYCSIEEFHGIESLYNDLKKLREE